MRVHPSRMVVSVKQVVKHFSWHRSSQNDDMIQSLDRFGGTFVRHKVMNTFQVCFFCVPVTPGTAALRGALHEALQKTSWWTRTHGENPSV